MSNKAVHKFCKLGMVYMKDHLVAHLGYKKNNGKMWGFLGVTNKFI